VSNLVERPHVRLANNPDQIGVVMDRSEIQCDL
jgi:hypothetical protein